MENMNLNINDYSIFDIEKCLGLGDTSIHNLENLLKILDTKIKHIKDKINSSKMNYEEKLKILFFLENAKNVMIYQKEHSETIDNNNYQITNKSNSKLEKNIIEHPNKQFIYTNNSNYYSGTVNPLNKRIITNYLLIDSKFRENYDTTNSSNFMVNLPTKLNNVVSIQLSSFEIPIISRIAPFEESFGEMLSYQISKPCDFAKPVLPLTISGKEFFKTPSIISSVPFGKDGPDV
jgi:hypothetical protein